MGICDLLRPAGSESQHLPIAPGVDVNPTFSFSASPVAAQSWPRRGPVATQSPCARVRSRPLVVIVLQSAPARSA
jgi:hypothetical protein